MSEGLRERIAGLTDDLIDWRRQLHQMPELGFEEVRTAEFIEARLRSMGFEPRTGVAETGVVAILRADSPVSPAVLLRADMDALPIQEVAGRPYGSKTTNRMHACGHDGHMAMLLGAAQVLSERRASLSRDVVFCFQPAEEGAGGAQRMLEEGVLEMVETSTVYALHLWSQFPTGTIHLRPGPAMGAVDEFGAKIIGRGGHGALPQHCHDPIVTAASAVLALQTIVSRNVDPIEAAVVTVGSIHAGSATNVIPDAVELQGTLRSFTPAVRELLRRRVAEVLDGVASAGGCRVEFELRAGYPALVNDARIVEIARKAALDTCGEQFLYESPPIAASEDFSYFLEQRPGAFIFVGSGNESAGITAQHHSPDFDIDEPALPQGVELLVRLATASES
jgi:amidohydrolase